MNDGVTSSGPIIEGTAQVQGGRQQSGSVCGSASRSEDEAAEVGLTSPLGTASHSREQLEPADATGAEAAPAEAPVPPAANDLASATARETEELLEGVAQGEDDFAVPAAQEAEKQPDAVTELAVPAVEDQPVDAEAQERAEPEAATSQREPAAAAAQLPVGVVEPPTETLPSEAEDPCSDALSAVGKLSREDSVGEVAGAPLQPAKVEQPEPAAGAMLSGEAGLHAGPSAAHVQLATDSSASSTDSAAAEAFEDAEEDQSGGDTPVEGVAHEAGTDEADGHGVHQAPQPTAPSTTASASMETCLLGTAPSVQPPPSFEADCMASQVTSFQREVSAKLLEVLSQEQMQADSQGEDSDSRAERASSAAMAPGVSDAQAAQASAAAGAAVPAAARAPDDHAALLMWAPPARQGSMRGKLGRGTSLPSPAPDSTTPASPLYSTNRRMAPMEPRGLLRSNSRPPATLTRGQSVRMPPLQHSSPPQAGAIQGKMSLQLAGSTAPPSSFPVLPAAPTGTLLHWSRRQPAAHHAPQAPVPPGWFSGVPVPAASFAPSAPAMPTTDVSLQAAAAHAELRVGIPVPLHGQAASFDEDALQHQQDPAAASSTQQHTAAGDAAGTGDGPVAQSLPAPASAADGGTPLQAGLEPNAAHPYLMTAGDPALAARSQPAHELHDVTASWPPYEGARLPPLYQDRVSMAAGLIPAVHSAASFAVPAGHRFRQRGAAHAWQAQEGAAGLSGALPPGMWMGQWPGHLTSGQQQAMYYQQYQQAQLYQQQQQSGYQQHQEASMAAAAQQLHPDGHHFVKEPMPQVPVALDPSGRPFKVFHGVAARSIKRPDRYQGDGRPAWSVK